MSIEPGGTRSGLLSRLPVAPLGSHTLAIYENEAFLNRTVAEFLAPALRSAGSAVVLATPAHRHGFASALEGAGIDVIGARQSGCLVELDARETLEQFMIGGSPDPGLFELTVGGLFEGIPADGEVLVFGELVALLRDDGNGAAAVALEDLWNGLAARHQFALLCAYPSSAFVREEATAEFLRICDRHSVVIPAESFSGAEPALAQRAVAILQQRAAAACTEREQLRQALERIQELDRLRQECVAMLVHDIRGPLAVAAGYLDLLRSKRDTLGPEKLDQFVANGLEAAARIERLLDDMLAASSLEAMEFTYELRLLDLGEVVRATVDQFCRATGADVDVIVAPSLPWVLADHARQTQIMENLLTNAVRCSPPSSPVRVVVGRVPEGVRVSVIDRGAGFDASDATKLFSPFDGIGRDGAHGASRPGPGLWLAKSLVEGQGGTISASSVRGHGSTFTYTVPAAPG